jgi:biopolymer transport protein ExbD
MAMNVGTGRSSDEPDVMMDINTTPLIDVMLVLIIMLIITIPVQLHAVNLAMPAGAPPTAPPVGVTVDIDFDGTVIWNGDTLPDRAALEARLRAVAAQRDQPEVHVRPNKLVEYKSVAMVLAAAQRLGVTRLGMVGNEQYAR